MLFFYQLLFFLHIDNTVCQILINGHIQYLTYLSFSCRLNSLCKIVTDKYKQAHHCYVVKQEQNQRLSEVEENELILQKHIAAYISFNEGVNAVARYQQSYRSGCPFAYI